jgi:hypothetical protein
MEENDTSEFKLRLTILIPSGEFCTPYGYYKESTTTPNRSYNCPFALVNVDEQGECLYAKLIGLPFELKTSEFDIDKYSYNILFAKSGYCPCPFVVKKKKVTDKEVEVASPFMENRGNNTTTTEDTKA